MISQQLKSNILLIIKKTMKATNKEGWSNLQDSLKNKYPQLTETDLKINVGCEDKMLRMVEYKLRMTKIEMQIIIEKL